MSATLQVRQLKAPVRFGRTLALPAWVADSGRPGPALLLTAAQHGNEMQGSEAIRRFMDEEAPRLVAGRIFAVPFCNLPAIRERRPHVGMQAEQAYEKHGGLNMNRAWPGRRRGNVSERLAGAIHEAFGTEATHVLDIHCWQKHAAPAILLHDLPGMRDLARQLGHRFVDLRPVSDRTLVGWLCSTGRIGVTYECAGQYTVDPTQVAGALRVIVNLARVIGLLPGAPEPPEGPVLFSDETVSAVLTAPCSGLFVKADLALCQAVPAGAVLGHVLSDADLARRPVTAPTAGYLRALGAARPRCDVSITGHHPYVAEGEPVATLVRPGAPPIRA